MKRLDAFGRLVAARRRSVVVAAASQRGNPASAKFRVDLSQIGYVVRMGLGLFETAVGVCGVAWGPEGLCRVRLPEASAEAMRARLGGVEEAMPEEVRVATEAMTALLAGERIDLGFVRLDWRGVSPFHRRVYEVARTIGPGEVRTYGEVARSVGDPGAARAVGQALGRNPFAVVVPCHRVLAKGGTGGFSAPGGANTKLRMLAIEGVSVGTLPLW